MRDKFRCRSASVELKEAANGALIQNNCLASALRFWKQHPEYRLFYNSEHVICIHATFIKSDSDIKFLPAESYGYNYFKMAFNGLLDEYEMKILREYFNNKI